MTSLLEGARKLVSRGSDVGARIDRPRDAPSTHARVGSTTPSSTTARRSSTAPPSRLRLSADHTVVAIAGATGSGKSSTFNALTGLELSAVGVRRPTTSWATACVWGDRRRRPSCSSGSASRPGTRSPATPCSTPAARTTRLDGVVLLDLPDHDSTEVSHHLEVDRLVQLADLLVWVLDPQKYADAAIHDRYLAPLASAQGRDAGGAQPHRHGARGAPRRDARRRTPAARPRRARRGPGARHQRPPGHRHGRAEGRDRQAGQRQEDRPAPGSRPTCRAAAAATGSSVRHRQARQR